MALNVSCPRCGNALELPDDALGNKASCVVCQQVFVVKAMPAQHIGQQNAAGSVPVSGNSEGEPKEASSSMELLLTVIEDGLKRMIVGIPRFFLVSIRGIFRLLFESMPVVARLISITFYIAVLAAVIFGPLLLTSGEQYWPDWIQVKVLSAEDLAWFKAHIEALRVLAVLWLVLSCCGALWGLVHIRKKAKSGITRPKVPA